ncbi:hypothetical protein D3C75_1215430 [compost metagenome]
MLGALIASEVVTDIGIQLVFPAFATAGAQALGVATATDVGIVLAVQPLDGDP